VLNEIRVSENTVELLLVLFNVLCLSH